MFAIELRSPGGGAGRGLAEAAGTITVGGCTESFRVPLGFWDESGHRRSWRRAFDVLDSGPRAVSCMVTSMTDPRTSNFLGCWPLYRDGEDVRTQNAIIFLSGREAFDPEAPWDHVEPWSAADEDGNVISEWVESMDSLRWFFG